jgi:uncharacterized protein (DUF302 family)
MVRKEPNMHEGLETIATTHTADQVVARLLDLIKQRGIQLFCVIDHAGQAAAAGLAMRPTKLVIFGNAKAGTPLMIDAPSTGLDLPLKILVTETESGNTLLLWNDPAWLEQRHGFRANLTANLDAIRVLAEAAAAAE